MSRNSEGVKFDSVKPPVVRGVIQMFPLSMEAIAKLSELGAQKYSWDNWHRVPDGFDRYTDAMGRHLIGEALDGILDPDSGEAHAAHVAWNALARLELLLRNNDHAV